MPADQNAPDRGPGGPVAELPTPVLEPVMELRVFVAEPVEAGAVLGLNSRGRRRIIPITGGEVRFLAGLPGDASTAPRRGRILPGGADFQIVVSDTSADLDARYVIEVDGGRRIYVQNRALRRGAPEDIARLVRGEAVEPSRIYFRCVPRFEVSDPSLAWMTESVFIGTGARFPDRVEIRVFRVG